MNIPKAKQLPSGRWFIRLRLNKQAYSKTFATEKEAIAWATMIKAEHKAGVLKGPVPAEQMTLRQLLTAYVAENILAENTKKIFRTVERHHFQPAMDRPVSSVTNWQRLINTELQSCNPNTVKLYWHKVSAAMRYQGIDPPRVKIATQPLQRKNYMDKDELKRFCDHIVGNPYEVYFLMMLHSMRVSEALSVRPEDISDKGIHVRGTKTPASDRVIPWMIPRLKELCADFTWKRLDPGTLAYQLNIITNQLDLPHLSCHSMRVTFAAMCYYKQVPEHIVMKIGGWSEPGVIHKHYLRFYDDDIQSWATKVSGLFEEPTAE